MNEQRVKHIQFDIFGDGVVDRERFFAIHLTEEVYDLDDAKLTIEIQKALLELAPLLLPVVRRVKAKRIVT